MPVSGTSLLVGLAWKYWRQEGSWRTQVRIPPRGSSLCVSPSHLTVTHPISCPSPWAHWVNTGGGTAGCGEFLAQMPAVCVLPPHARGGLCAAHTLALDCVTLRFG